MAEGIAGTIDWVGYGVGTSEAPAIVASIFTREATLRASTRTATLEIVAIIFTRGATLRASTRTATLEVETP